MAKIAKDAYYFPHFSNARHDRKIKRLRKEIGVEGYGIYFMVLEVLRDQEDFSYPISDIDLLADEFSVSEQNVEQIVKNYGLFKIDDDQSFYSPKLIEYLKPYLERSKRARDAAIKRWHGDSNANADTNALPEHSNSNAKRVNDSKSNESIVNTPPPNHASKKPLNTEKHKPDSIEQVIDFFDRNGLKQVHAEEFYNHYKMQGWVRSNGMAITSWQSAASQWILNELHNPPEWKQKQKKSKNHGQQQSVDTEKIGRQIEQLERNQSVQNYSS